MSTDNLVWYASYGSNAFRQRFHCYVRGGRITGNIRLYSGCRNTALPLDEQNIIIPHRLYFAKKSKSWSQGGVAFIGHEKTSREPSYGRMYLITREQFADVVKQETRNPEDVNINFERVQEEGQLDILENVWYGRIINLGTQSGYPIFTFTNTAALTDFNAPSPAYLKTILSALWLNFKLDHREIIDYLINKPGLKQQYSGDDLKKMLTEVKDSFPARDAARKP